MIKRLTGLASLLALAACTSLEGTGAAVRTGWVGAWGASPTPPPANAQAFDNQTVRQVVRLTATGNKVRIRFTNEYGEKPLEIGAATLSLASPDGAPTGAPIPITFGGKANVSIPRFAPMLSDAVALPVKALDSVSISIFLPKPTGPCTCHFLGTATSWISGPGDFTKAGFEPASTFTQRAFISAVQVESAAPTSAIIAFGDSITDGYRSTNAANRRWPDVLAERLAATKAPVSVVNEAISGNRVLNFGNIIFGDAALARFDRDVLTVPNAKWMIVLEGINDIGQGGDTRPSAEVMIEGYRQIISRAHDRGLKVYGATLIPFEGAAYYKPEGEVIRAAVNQWIRTSGEYDAVIDLDAAIRDPANPKKMKADLQSGDWLHPNDAGYKVMGDAIDLKLFQ